MSEEPCYQQEEGLIINRSSHPEVFCEKGVLRNFTKFTGRHLCESFFFNKVTLARVLSCEFCEVSKNTSFQRTPLVTASESTIAFKRKSFGDYDVVLLTMLYLKVPRMVWFHEIFGLSFQKQPSSSKKYVLNIEIN